MSLNLTNKLKYLAKYGHIIESTAVAVDTSGLKYYM
eukprot:SAG31_NODE_3555_length_4129_cov_1.868734_3_plen_36_part_00